jgi:hypothetical protein
MTVAKLIIEVRKVRARSHDKRRSRGAAYRPCYLHGLLNILFHELLDSLRCLKATGETLNQ